MIILNSFFKATGSAILFPNDILFKMKFRIPIIIERISISSKIELKSEFLQKYQIVKLVKLVKECRIKALSLSIQATT